jgi:hypothetical protein
VRVICRVMPVIMSRLPRSRRLFLIKVGVFGCGNPGEHAVLPGFRQLKTAFETGSTPSVIANMMTNLMPAVSVRRNMISIW